MSGRAAEQVAALVREHGINPEDISGIAERRERQQQASDAGLRLERTLVDALIDLLGVSPPRTPAKPSAPMKPLRDRLPRIPVGATP